MFDIAQSTPSLQRSFGREAMIVFLQRISRVGYTVRLVFSEGKLNHLVAIALISCFVVEVARSVVDLMAVGAEVVRFDPCMEGIAEVNTMCRRKRLFPMGPSG